VEGTVVVDIMADREMMDCHLAFRSFNSVSCRANSADGPEFRVASHGIVSSYGLSNPPWVTLEGGSS
jgi:hypothetical protein